MLKTFEVRRSSNPNANFVTWDTVTFIHQITRGLHVKLRYSSVLTFSNSIFIMLNVGPWA